jgi:hypothetical protein
MAPLAVAFTAGAQGAWRIESVTTLQGPALAPAPCIAVTTGAQAAPPGAWTLRGVVSNLRYTTAAEVAALAAAQQGLSRPEASCAALIPIRKTAAWWAMAQDERRAVMETRSRHNAIGMEYLPAIARRLHHGRDLGEPFDFLTWFDFAPAHAADFEALLRRLRASEEWGFVDREVDIRLARIGG